MPSLKKIALKNSGIIAKRFDIFSKETNLGSFNFGEGPGSDILNIDYPNPDLDKLKVPDLLKTAQNMGVSALSMVTSQLGSLRGSKTSLSSLIDWSGVSSSAMTSMLQSVFSGSPSQVSQYSDLLRGCRGMSSGYGGRPYSNRPGCGGGSGKMGSYGSSRCNMTNYNSSMRNLTGMQFRGANMNQTQNMMNMFMGLSSTGYGAGQCGVFSALSQSSPFDMLGNNELMKAAAGLMGKMSGSKNSSGWMDIAGASTGLMPGLAYPDVISDFTSSFSLPEGMNDFGLTGMAEQVRGSFDLVDDLWNQGGQMGEIMVADLMGASDDLRGVFEADLFSNSFTEMDLDTFMPMDDIDFENAAVMFA